jgi:flagellar motility protein MotE (MotC chaperone)
MPVLLEVVERMRAVKSADVLARMDPVKAKQVTSELARRSELLEADRAATGAAPGQSRI